MTQAKHSFILGSLFSLTLGAAVLAQPSVADAANFTKGNLVVYRVGDGVTPLASTGAAVFLDEFTPSGTLVQSVPMPTTATLPAHRLIASGVATSEGLLTLSADGRYLILTGYDAAIPWKTGTTSSVATSTLVADGVLRVVARVASDATVDTSTALTDWVDANNPRSAVSSDGTALWLGGANGGVRYTTLGSTTSTQLSTTVTNIRQVNIFGGQLYNSDSSGAVTRLGAVGTGLPTTSGQTITSLPGISASAGSPYAFYMADLTASVPGVDTLYVVDDTATTGGITKYSLVSGTWTSNGTIVTTSVTPNDLYRGITGVVGSNGTTVTLYATRNGATGAAGGGQLVSLVDASGYNGAFAGTPTVIASAVTGTSANTAFRGVAMAPSLPTSIPALGGPSWFGTLAVVLVLAGGLMLTVRSVQRAS